MTADGWYEVNGLETWIEMTRMRVIKWMTVHSWYDVNDLEI